MTSDSQPPTGRYAWLGAALSALIVAGITGGIVGYAELSARAARAEESRSSLRRDLTSQHDDVERSMHQLSGIERDVGQVRTRLDGHATDASRRLQRIETQLDELSRRRHR